jgi:hypothetical protein
MKKSIGYAIIFVFIIAFMSFTLRVQQAKVYKLELTTQEVQVVYDALGELPAKVSEGVRAKVAKQVGEQNASGNK